MSISQFYWCSVYVCFGSMLITIVLNWNQSAEMLRKDDDVLDELIEKNNQGGMILAAMLLGSGIVLLLSFVPVVNTLLGAWKTFKLLKGGDIGGIL